MNLIETVFSDPRILFQKILDPHFWDTVDVQSVCQYLDTKQGKQKIVFAFEQLLVDSDLKHDFFRNLKSFRPDVGFRTQIGTIFVSLADCRYKTMEKMLRFHEIQTFIMRCLNGKSPHVVDFAIAMILKLWTTRKIAFHDEWRTLINDNFDSIWKIVRSSEYMACFLILGNFVKCKNYIFYHDSVKSRMTKPHINMGRICICCEEKKSNANIQLCAGCEVVRYCGVECQERDHKNHRRFCKSIRKMRKKFE